MVKWLLFCCPHLFWDGLIPFFAIRKNRVNVEHDTAKIKYAVAHNISDGKSRFNNIGSNYLIIHGYNIISSHVQINLVAWQSKKLQLMAPLCHRDALFLRQ